MRSQLLAVTLVRYSSGPRAWVPRLSTRLNMSTGFCVTSTTRIAAPTLVGCGLRLFLNFRPGRSPASRRYRSMGRMFAGRSEVIRSAREEKKAREHVAVRAVLGGDAPGDIVDRLQRDLVPDELGVELGELRAGVDGRALDADLAQHQHGFRRARRRLDAGDGDG